MFCPRCSQQQLSEEVRFCSRCGLPLAGVAAFLTDSAALTRETAARDTQLPAKRAGIRRGAKIMFWSFILLPIFFGLAVLFDSPGPLFVPATIFLAGITSLLYSVFFGEDLMPAGGFKRRKELSAMRNNPALDAPRFVPASAASYQRIDTAEIAQPLSVTENTTQLLDKDQQ
jgi:hypothetical protein